MVSDLFVTLCCRFGGWLLLLVRYVWWCLVLGCWLCFVVWFDCSFGVCVMLGGYLLFCGVGFLP